MFDKKKKKTCEINNQPIKVVVSQADWTDLDGREKKKKKIILLS
jgi:hypothetical protein